MLWVMVFVIQLLILAPEARASTWQKEAMRMTGAGPGEGATALKRLRKMPNLDEELRNALKTDDRFLAMDVIGNLRRESLREELISFSESDPTGFSYLALAAFINKKNSSEFQKLFLSRLMAPTTTAPAKMILLDTLSRMGTSISESDLTQLLARPSQPEVQSAVLRFLRTRLLRRPETSDLRLLEQALQDPNLSRQRLIQALYIVFELKPTEVARLSAPALVCPENLPKNLVAPCQQIQGGRR